MKKSVRRILSSVLCFALLIATVPTFIFAAGTASITIDGSSYSAGVDVAYVTSVTLPIKVEATNVNVADWKLTYDSNVFESVSVSLATGIAGSVESKNAAIWWEADDVQNISGNFIDLTLTLKAGAELGDTTVSVAGTMTDDDYEDIDVDASVTLSIIDGSASTSEYTANISTSATNNTVVNGEDIVVNVNVGGTTGEFSSAEIVLDYDPTYLTYKSVTTSSTDEQKPDYDVDDSNGTLTIRDYGEAITAADGVYTVTFTAAKGGSTNVELKSAGFSTKDSAETDDLLAATGLNELDVTINHKVTVNNADAGSVAPNGSYEYIIPNYDGVNNTYAITVTMGGAEQTAPTIGTDGKFTISLVTGDLVIIYTATANKYTVTFTDSTGDADGAVSSITGATLEEGVYKVTHGTDISFAVPANLEPVGTTDGYKYVVTVTETNDTSKTINATSSDNGNGLTYTIDGDLIEADITITVKKETVKADTVTVTVNGENVTIEGVTGNTTTVAKGDDVTLVLDPETGYTYEVKLGETDITSEILDDNKYTIEDITASVTVTVTKTLDKTSVNVQEYLTLDDDTTMWLVTVNGNGTTEISGKTYSYSGENMYWSSKYQAYCYLVVAKNLDTDTAKAAIGDTLVGQAATAVNYEMDVNMSETMDVNDAQLVWNMYNAEYSGITTNVTMEKFLRADVNATVGVDSTDAAAIISAIKTT